tara:strand:- start:378 stop:1961 length:1584 start_codon:yes stop_codon:yes gene_type:complete
MGGIARHMNHIYDDVDMKFSTILEIFKMASSGELKATEKVDGQNLYFTYDKGSGTVKFARKEEEAAAGGLSKEDLNYEFVKKQEKSDDPSGYQSVVDAFFLGMQTIEQALAKVSDDVKNSVFYLSKNVEGRQISTVYMNCEVMYSGNRNLILYDGDFIVFHNYDILDESLKKLPQEELEAIDNNMREKFMSIVSEIEKQEATAAADQWKVVGPQVVALNNMGEEGSQKFVAEARKDLESIIQPVGLSINDTLGDYIVKCVREKIVPSFNLDTPLSPDLVEAFCQLVRDPRSWSDSPVPESLGLSSDSRERARQIKQLYRGSKANTKAVSKIFTKSYSQALHNTLIEPFARFAVQYTSQILDGVESNFMIDSSLGKDVFVETVNMAIAHFEKMFADEDAPESEMSRLKDLSGDDEKMSQLDRKTAAALKNTVQRAEAFREKYEKQMGRLVSVDRITTPVEGVVFEYPPGSNKYYKFTGGFAASNQLLGMLGWADKERISQEARQKVVASSNKQIDENQLKTIIKQFIF